MAPKNVFAKINPLEATNAGIRQARVVHVVEHGTTRAGNLAQVPPQRQAVSFVSRRHSASSMNGAPSHSGCDSTTSR